VQDEQAGSKMRAFAPVVIRHRRFVLEQAPERRALDGGDGCLYSLTSAALRVVEKEGRCDS